MKNKKDIKELIDILESSKIGSLELSSFWGFRKIKLSKGDILVANQEKSASVIESNISDSRPVEKSSSKIDEKNIQEEKSLDVFIQKAPLVGTVYLSPKPGEPCFVNEGDNVKKGQQICIIEAMKVFNPIEAERDGIVYKVVVSDESPVEFGQPIIEIK